METVATSTALGRGASFSHGVSLAMDTYDYYSEKIQH